MRLKTFAILLSLSAACSSTTYAMEPNQEDRLQTLLKQRQAAIEKGHEIQAAQEKGRQDSKRTMEEADRNFTVAVDHLEDEGSKLMDAIFNGTMSPEEIERRISQL